MGRVQSTDKVNLARFVCLHLLHDQSVLTIVILPLELVRGRVFVVDLSVLVTLNNLDLIVVFITRFIRLTTCLVLGFGTISMTEDLSRLHCLLVGCVSDPRFILNLRHLVRVLPSMIITSRLELKQARHVIGYLLRGTGIEEARFEFDYLSWSSLSRWCYHRKAIVAVLFVFFFDLATNEVLQGFQS